MEMSPLQKPGLVKKTMSKNARKIWKFKLTVTWKAFKNAFAKRFRRRLSPKTKTNVKQLSAVKTHQQPPPQTIKNNSSRRPRKTLAKLLYVPYTASDFLDKGDEMTPTISPKQNISAIWQELHGSSNWETLLDPLHPCLRREILKYGEFVGATYDAFDFDPLSEYCGSCRFNRHKMFQELGLTKHGYNVTKYLYAMSHVDVPDWFEKIYTTWSKDSNWMGYVAVSDDQESRRIGRRDIVVAWRGTVAPTEWFSDLRTSLEYFDEEHEEKKINIKVQEGFLSIYKHKDQETRYNKQSASEQVMQELKRLVSHYREFYGEQKISLTVTGHSLGGALALLTAYEAAITIPNIFISVISFGAPRVGNLRFKEKLNELGVKTLRVVVKQDIVPKLPGIIVNNIINKISKITRKLNWVYRHVGTQLKLDMDTSPYLKRDADMSGSHNLEVYLHLLDGFMGKKMKFRWNARRDLALVNKSSDMLIEELRIPEFWYQMPHKGLVLNKYGRWIKPCREVEDIPSPFSTQVSKHELSF
ncbi:phospholipase A1-Igamma1, chloroplastic [Mercurialis annua]|uniref:phospholipase A1-Igamma1, chloroplastic n=1 Tax=Mercurialis annua TaxID=3986 RepID=UPI00215F8FFB|nr:phospholipase A1-Igamma1, chloroplastic [Mercurialis annua]